MKKIMFNDRYGLTKAVLEGRKTQTRRIIPLSEEDEEYLNTAFDFDLRESVIIDRYARYKIGEEVAVAQSYQTVMRYYHSFCHVSTRVVSEEENTFWDAMRDIESTGNDSAMKGDNNKMFVKADLMPHRIKITNVRVEHLQDISDEDCLKEGIYESLEAPYNTKKYGCFNSNINVCSPREAFAILINKVSGKGTWESNPWVFVYDFELIK